MKPQVSPQGSLPERPRQHLSGKVAKGTCAALAAAGLAWAGYAAAAKAEGWNAPSCAWPLRVHGTATGEQAGLVRCYLRALARNDHAGLLAVAADIPPVRITSGDLRYAAARSGLATATFTPDPVDDASCMLTIRYADRMTEETYLIDMDSMGGPDTWRIGIGTVINPGPQVPTSGP
jgi:hypothetical protein